MIVSCDTYAVNPPLGWGQRVRALGTSIPPNQSIREEGESKRVPLGGYGPQRLGGDFAPAWTDFYRPPNGGSKILVGPDLVPLLPLGESRGLYSAQGKGAPQGRFHFY